MRVGHSEQIFGVAIEKPTQKVFIQCSYLNGPSDLSLVDVLPHRQCILCFELS